jgi:hypothetical protein
MLLNFQDIDEHFNQIGFMDRHEIKYTIRYYSEELKEYFYISKISGASPSTLIIHPKYEHLKIKLLSILGVVNESEYRHGTSMRKFPEKINNGKRPTAYGIPLGFRNLESLSSFINFLSKN